MRAIAGREREVEEEREIPSTGFSSNTNSQNWAGLELEAGTPPGVLCRPQQLQHFGLHGLPARGGLSKSQMGNAAGT